MVNQHCFGMGCMGGWGMWLFLLLIVFLIVFLYRGFGYHGHHYCRHKYFKKDDDIYEPPLDILKKRYAKGEIDAEEFAKKKKELGYE